MVKLVSYKFECIKNVPYFFPQNSPNDTVLTGQGHLSPTGLQNGNLSVLDSSFWSTPVGKKPALIAATSLPHNGHPYKDSGQSHSPLHSHNGQANGKPPIKTPLDAGTYPSTDTLATSNSGTVSANVYKPD